MKGVNFYFAALIITLAGAGAVWLILHVVYANNFDTTIGGSGARFAPLQESILNQ